MGIGTGPASIATSHRTREAAILAGLFSSGSLIRDALLFRVFGFTVAPDTLGYLQGASVRSRPYVIMAAVTRAHSDPLALVWLQIVVAALATGALVYVIARRLTIAGPLVGLLLVSDMAWAQANRTLLTESPAVSFAVLSLAVLLQQLDRRQPPCALWLVLAGVLYGWTVSIRPSNVFLAVPIIIGYLATLRSWRKAACVATGITLLLAGTSLVTWKQHGRLQLSGEWGLFVAYPLFVYQLFDPGNGPSSRLIDATVADCHLDLNYSEIVIVTSNANVMSKIARCLATRLGRERAVSTMMVAYVEAIHARPLAWARYVTAWTFGFVGYRFAAYQESGGGDCNGLQWCERYRRKFAPLPGAEEWQRWENEIVSWSNGLRLLPLAIVAKLDPAQRCVNGAIQSPKAPPAEFVVPVSLSWLAVIGILWTGTSGFTWLMAVASLVLIFYTATSVVVGHVFLPRYAMVLGPPYTLVSVCLVLAVWRLLVVFPSTLLRSWLAERQRHARWHAAMGLLQSPDGPALAGIVASVALAAALYVAIPPERWPDAFQHHAELHGPYDKMQGYGFVARLSPGLLEGSDSNESPERSTVRLRENDRAIGTPHAYHQDIFGRGQGRYSHWGGNLIFSTEDNSDPNVNGRRYSIVYARSFGWLPYLAMAVTIVWVVRRVRSSHRT